MAPSASRYLALRQHGQSMFRLARGDIRFETVFGALPALAACLGIGIAIGRPELGMIAAGGALSVGFGAFQRFTALRAAPMLFALAGMMIATFAGSLAGGHPVTLVLLAGLVAALCAGSNAAGPGAWWVTLQWAIATFVAGAFPADLAGAAERTMLVLAGGASQLLVLALVWRLLPHDFGDAAQRASERWQDLFLLVVHNLADRREVLGFTAAVTATVMVAAAIGQILPTVHGYWVPVTALIVMRPSASTSIQRIIYRLVGTVAGAGIITLLAALLRPGEILLAILCVALVGLSFSLQRSGYAIFTAAVTGTVALLSTLAGLPEMDVAIDRVEATLIGGGLGLITALGLMFIESRRQHPGQ